MGTNNNNNRTMGIHKLMTLIQERAPKAIKHI